jgi:Protein of unknown function (DUF3592)
MRPSLSTSVPGPRGRGFLYRRLAGRELGIWLFMAISLAAFVGFGGGVLFWAAGVEEWRAQRASGSWPAVTGRVVWIGRARKARSLRVLYEYEYAGRRIRTGHVVFGAVGYAEMQAFDERYDVGDAVSVYVDPDDPGLAVLERRMGSRWLLFPGFGLCLVTVGLAIVRFVWRATKPGAAR